MDGEIISDNRKMKRFICERIPEEGIRIVIADGAEGGPAWADLTPIWDEGGGCDLMLDSNEPEWVRLREVFDHFRLQEITWREWRTTLVPMAAGPAPILKLPPPGDTASPCIISPVGLQTTADEDGVGGYLTLTEAARLIPGRRPGKRVSLGTVWRWCTQGLRNGIRLQSVLAGGQRCTTRRWLQDFIEAMSQDSQPSANDRPTVRTPTQRQTASERAAEELKAAWEGRRHS